MNLKSYLRGIGIGILVTSAVFIISGSADKSSAISDDMIIARAKELGMVESAATVADVGNAVQDEFVSPTIEPIEEKTEETDTVPDESTDSMDSRITLTPEEPTEEDKAEVTEASPTAEVEKVTVTPKPTEEPKPTVTPASDKKEEEPKEDKKEETPAKNDSSSQNTETGDASDNVIIVINPGDGSDTAARKVAQAGLVPDAAAFDRFLIDGGYDRKITTGNHVILKSMTPEEIAKNLISSTR